MRATFGDFRQVAGMRGFWSSALRAAVAISFALALLAVALTAFVFVLPVLLAGGLALHLYLRRKLRQAQRQAHRTPFEPGGSPSGPAVIEGEYVVVDRDARRT